MSHRQPDRYASHHRGSGLEYDLVHEEVGDSTNRAAEHPEQQITVATGTPDYDGDYSYDLAHDIPGPHVSRST